MQIAAVADRLSLADFFALEFQGDRNYELERGYLREMPTEI
jgi:hypothetical protein